MRLRLWRIYKFTYENCRLRLFSELVQSQKSYSTCTDKIGILTCPNYLSYQANIFVVN